MAESHLGVVTGENPLTELETRDVTEQGHRERERGHRGGLGRQYEGAGGHGGERGTDLPVEYSEVIAFTASAPRTTAAIRTPAIEALTGSNSWRCWAVRVCHSLICE